MDNLRFDVTSQGREHFDLIMRIAFENAPGGRAEGYKLSDKGFVLFWGESANATPLPFSMSLVAASDFVWAWLAAGPKGRAPDVDGDVGHGWRVFCEDWGNVDHDPYAFVAIQPVWALYGK